MTQVQAMATQEDKPEQAAMVPLSTPLPAVETALSPDEIVNKLDTAARRGKLPGFHAGGRGLFDIEAFGQPFEGVMTAATKRTGDTTTITFQAKLLPKMPWIFVIVSVLTIWPGVWFTESMLSTWFPSAKWLWGTTCWWYLILSVPTTPWYLWSAFKKSRAGVHTSAHGSIKEIAALVQGRLVG
ncbi:MAG: hypothetical protein ACREJO_04500 [Phycisphaerales bacterium]